MVRSRYSRFLLARFLLARFVLAAALSGVLALSACAGLGGLGRVVRPEVRILGVDVDSVGLDSVKLAFDVEVDNPNTVNLVLDTIDYRLHLNGQRLLDGQRDERMEIAARTESRVQLPVTIRYTDLVRALGTLNDRDRPSYELQADFGFDVPVLGRVTVPLRERGEIPLDRLRRLGR